ncbi:MAG: cation:proton antiporter [Deltaproteobacteria bacterium]|uniref:Cation:proton antiporter n=1 Tax=Candidatus Zymogenus saltonus TaxID=2844893 RepID=A0A9D8KHT2_9DELT|nr:cation:proton antiporter [Candidatus Zymogenus saltonus]
MRYLFPLMAITVVFYGLVSLPFDGAMERGGVAISIGFLMLSSYFMGGIAEKAKLPRITGYLACGILFGPHLLGLVDSETVVEMRFIDGLALTFIALAAGGELKIPGLKERIKVIALNILFQVTAIFFGCVVILFFLGPIYGVIPPNNISIAVTAGLVTASVMASLSPSTMMAVISETRAAGPFTESIMGITVAMDVVVLILFTLSVTFGGLFVNPGGDLNSNIVFILVFEIVGNIGVGALLGIGLINYIKYVNRDLSVILLLFALLITSLAQFFSEYLTGIWGFNIVIEPLLIAITAGFVVENLSPKGDELLKTIDESSLPIYVIFFAVAGASLDLKIVSNVWALTLIIMGYRLFALFTGSLAAGRILKEPKIESRWMGISYTAQAGVSIGLAVKLGAIFPDWGVPVASLILSVVTLNQIVGPVFLKLALERVGETKKRGKNPLHYRKNRGKIEVTG